MKKFFFVFCSSAFLFSCASQDLIRDKDYSPSLALYKQSEFENALERFPKKEENGFITSVEKSWISLWNHHGDNSQLEKQVRSLDDRQYTSISRETEYFFFNETADGYIPSEHEVIAMHLINSMVYMQQSKWDDAEVEARRASYFLQKIFNPDQPHFDDPALRLWLAAVWMSLDNWDAAQVDLRKICELNADPAVKKLIDLATPPEFFRLNLTGSGPELIWKNGEEAPEFVIPTSTSGFSSEAWYQRHLKRNTAIRETVLKSNYMSQYLGIKTSSGTQKAMGYSFGGASRLLGVALGGAIVVGGIYLAAQAPSGNAEAIGYILGAGVLVGKFFWDAGGNIIDSVNKDANDYEARKLEDLRTYRFVRFLPNKIYFQLDKDGSLQNSLTLFRPQSKTQVEYHLNP